MNENGDDIRLYFTRVRPLYGEMFAMARLICGNYEQAEYALGRVILTGFQSRRRFRSSRGFRESLRADMRDIALGLEIHAGDADWDCLAGDEIDGPSDDALSRALSQEDTDVRRMVMLKYGCGLDARMMARMTGVPRRQAEQTLNRLIRRLSRRLPREQRGHIDARATEICREELRAGGAEAPDIGAAYRAFEAEASRSLRPVSRVASRIAVRAACVLALVFVAVMIWLTAAVLRPALLERDGLQTETLEKQ